MKEANPGISYENSYRPFLNNVSKYPILIHCMELNDNASECKNYLFYFFISVINRNFQRELFFFFYQKHFLFKGHIIPCILENYTKILRKQINFLTGCRKCHTIWTWSNGILFSHQRFGGSILNLVCTLLYIKQKTSEDLL